MSKQAVPIKLVVVGDGAIGKTCILISYVQDRFPIEYVPTIFQTYTSTIRVQDQIVNLGLWDTAGQQEYAKLRPLAYSGTDVFLIVFSVVEPASYINAKKKWYTEIHDNMKDSIIIFVGNKIDLRDDMLRSNPKSVIHAQQAKAQLGQLGCMYRECSALTQQGLKGVFVDAITSVLSKKNTKILNKKENLEEEDVKCNCQMI